MNTHMSIRGQGHCLTFVQGHSDLYFQTSAPKLLDTQSQISCETFMMWGVGVRICSNDVGHMTIHVNDKILQKKKSLEPNG